ncbi:MAG: hypothetical protein ACRD22_21380 [Terriglobia bacterium]
MNTVQLLNFLGDVLEAIPTLTADGEALASSLKTFFSSNPVNVQKLLDQAQALDQQVEKG